MLKNYILSGFVAASFLGVVAARQSPVNIQVNQTAATSGKQMYISYCAPCHGVNGRGNGPAAPAMKVPPTDLTVLSKNNQGKFPAYHVEEVLRFGSELSAHGSAAMPVWGPVLTRVDTNDTDHSKEALRISNLARYIETLQVK